MFSLVNVALISLILTFLAQSAVVEPQNQSLKKRVDILAGWALVVESTCPPGTFTCGSNTCCPTGSECDIYEASSNLCCPTDNPYCLNSIINNGTRCAIDSWVLYQTTRDPICCLPGQIGTQPEPPSFFGGCEAAEAIANNPLATLVGTGVTVPYTATNDNLYTGASQTATSTPTIQIQSVGYVNTSVPDSGKNSSMGVATEPPLTTVAPMMTDPAAAGGTPRPRTSTSTSGGTRGAVVYCIMSLGVLAVSIVL